MNSIAYKDVLDSICGFVAEYPDDRLDRFRDSVAKWGSREVGVEPVYLSAADFIDDVAFTANEHTRDLLSVFNKHKRELFWEQSYKKSDGLVGDDMLAGYGFAEVIGKNGPFVSEHIRAGIGVWGPHIDYPRHQHKAEEIYLVVAGSADFKIGEAEVRHCKTGDVVFVESMTPHEFATTDNALVVFYLWQAGDLRETSTFL